MTVQPFSSASIRMVRETSASAQTTMQPASISMAASWLSLRLLTMTTSPLWMTRSICSTLPEPTTMPPSTTLPLGSPTSTVPFTVSMMFS